MRELGYGSGYRYDHDDPEGVAPQHYLPDALRGQRFYEPGDSGEEAAIAERLRRAAHARGREPSG
jgi:putative ATPase